VAVYARRWAARADGFHPMEALFDDHRMAGADGCRQSADVTAVYGVAVLGDVVAAAVATRSRAALR